MGTSPPRRFLYRGRSTEARTGETLLAAVSHGGLPLLERSLRYHRPRAPFCGIGQCTGCLVRVNGDPTVRSCRYLPSEGDRVDSPRGWPSVRRDLFGLLDLLFPQGIDAFRSLRRPMFATPLYQRVVRRLSGYGPPPPGVPPPEPSGPLLRKAEVVVVGGGASGEAVSHWLQAHGAHPLRIDRALGPTNGVGPDVLTGTSVTFLTPPRPNQEYPFALLGFDSAGGGVCVSARSVILATGGYDASLLFGNNDRPGVMTADLALAFSPEQERSWFHRAIVVGGGDRANEVLERLGSRVAAVVAPGEIRPDVVRIASELDIPLYPRSLVLRARGRSRVRGLDLKGRGGGPRFSLAGDAVVLAHRRLPNVPLFRLAGARTVWHPATAAHYPEVDPSGRTSVPGLYAVGPVAGPGAVTPAAVGEAVTVGAGERPVVGPSPIAHEVPAPGELEGYYRELLREPRRGRWIACRCEDILLREVEAASRAGYRGGELVKRYSALGTGLCQGRYCLPDVVLVLSVLEGRPPPEVGTVTARPPVFPTTLRALSSLDTVTAEEAA